MASRLHEVSDVAASGDVAALEGWLAAPEAFAVPSLLRQSRLRGPPPTHRSDRTKEPGTSITMTTRIWDGNDGNIYIGGFVGFGISRGQVAALTPPQKSA
ncbi:MAG: hypothetical protein IPO40_24980 [Fibrobacteres bacterium]|nr:hypothetical protein [Fibrobacterota bacterium]